MEQYNTSVATVNSSGIVTAVAAGNVTITGRYTYSGSTYTDTVSISVYDSIGILNNTSYYIMNYSSGRLLSLETASDTALTNVYTRARSAMTLSQWKTRKLSDGYFNLQSVYSSTGKCLDVTGTNVDIYNDNGGGYLKFSIYRVESGTYQGLYLIKHNDSGLYVTQDSDYDVYVTATPTAASYWSFSAVEKRYANYYSISSPNTQGKADLYTETFELMGYDSYNWHCQTAVWAYGALQNTNDVFLFVGHGTANANNIPTATIGFQTSSGDPNGRITANRAISNGANDRAIDDLSDNALASAKCVLYIGCSTGTPFTANNGVTYNLVDSTFKKGAHFVLGTKETINVSKAYTFIENFLRYCAIDSIYQSIRHSVIDDPTFQAYYVGDTKQHLNIY